VFECDGEKREKRIEGETSCFTGKIKKIKLKYADPHSFE
jgi:hypothetical protein